MSGSVGDDLLSLARRVAGGAGPGEEVEAYVVRSEETEVEVYDGEVESLTTAGVEGIGVRVVVGGRQGLAWAGSLEPEVVAETLREARDNARFSAVDEHCGLATPADAAACIPPDLDLWRADLATVPTAEKVRLALELERATRAGDPRIRNVEGAGYGDARSESALATSTGIEAESRRTTCSASVAALADDGSGTQSGYGFTTGRAVGELDLEAAARDAVVRSCRLLGARPVPGRRIPIVLDPLVTRAFLGVCAGAFDGEAVLKGRSLFADRFGEAVAAPGVRLVDDPTDPRAPGAARFDGEGIPTRRNDLVVDGVLQRFLHNVATGRRAGVPTTASATRSFASVPGVGVRALRLEPGSLGPDEILRRAGDALYVQSVSGLHSGTNPISGDFSVGAVGLVVRDGELGAPVREVTIASTLQRMLLDIVEVGSDLVFLPGATAGLTLLIGEMTLSGA
ncbi:MAG: TldD/PmbA family protein [Actinomycetota bacterium]